VRLRVGISTCPNDTFAFHAVMERKVDMRGLEFELELHDVQELNDRLFAGAYDVSKASYHAALLLAGSYGLLRVGSALGFGVGPLLVATDPEAELTPASRVLCPGATTTATLLFRCLHPDVPGIEQRVFSDIVPALRRGEADFGVLIHEGRLTYQRDGLSLIEDLGTSFEQVAQAPVPLGGILARLDLADDVPDRVASLIRDSIAYGWANRDEVLATIRRYAQELDEDVIWPYVELYVNDHTVDFGADGLRAIATLERTGEAAGVIDRNLTPVRILETTPVGLP
jgi:1,4-dihydroxy-6-naphthoate synthase